MNHPVSNTSDWLLGAMKKNPEGLLLLAAGAALLLRKSGALAPANGRPRQGSPTSGISKAVSGAQEFASNVADRASETVSSVASSATDFAGKAGRAVGEQSGRVAQQAQSTFQGSVNRILRDRRSQSPSLASRQAPRSPPRSQRRNLRKNISVRWETKCTKQPSGSEAS